LPLKRSAFTDPDTIYENVHGLGWSVGETGGVRRFTVELSRGDRFILAPAPTVLMACQLAERAAVGDSGYDD
jgi:hypothetical protein